MKNAIVIAAAVSAVVASLVTVMVMRREPAAVAVAQTAPDPSGERFNNKPVGRGAGSDAGMGRNEPKAAPGASMGSGAEDEARTRAEAAALERRFREEPKDGAWASKTEQALRETMTSDVMARTEILPTALKYSCRTDLCQVRAEFTKYGDAADWGVMLITASGATFVNATPIIVALPNGKTELQMYAARH